MPVEPTVQYYTVWPNKMIWKVVFFDWMESGRGRGSELVLHLKAGARLGGKFAVAVDGGARETQPQQEHEGFQGNALRGCASVLGLFAVGGQTTDVANADAVRIVPFAVCADLVERSAGEDCAVQPHDVVVSHVAKALGLVPAANVVHGEGASFRRGGAVDNDFVDVSHNQFLF